MKNINSSEIARSVASYLPHIARFNSRSSCGEAIPLVVHPSMASSDVKLVPLSPDAKPLVLRLLQGELYFETTLTAATAAITASSCGLTIPSWFVGKHGDKFRKSVILRTESSQKPWPVRLSIWYPSPTTTQVKFSGGWQAFAVSNELVEGDSLMFVLTAMSEFKVYLFRSMEGRKESPVRKRRRRKPTSTSNGSENKAKQRNGERGDERVGAGEERSGEGSIDLNRKPREASDSAFAPVPPPPPPADSEDTVRHHPSFSKTLSASNVSQNTGASLEFPEDFWKMHSDRIHSVVTLQGIHEQSPVRAMTCFTSLGKESRHYMRAEWRDFVAENRLHEGQQLLFTLAADSFFVVRERSTM